MPTLPRERLSVVIPVYRAFLDPRETISLDSTFRVLGGHHLVLVKPEGLDTSAIERRYRFGGVERFDPSLFGSVQGYNRLLLSSGFYQRFLGSEYLLVCQPDVFVFRDDLARWLERDYDYVGAPWVSRTALGAPFHRLKMLASQLVLGVQDRIYRFETRGRVGNGGFSLRRVAVHHRLSLEMKDAVERYLLRQGTHHFNEDIFWSLEPEKHGFAHRTPALEEALAFSWDINPARLFRLSGGRLPMAAHGWYKRERLAFWEPHVLAARAAAGGPTPAIDPPRLRVSIVVPTFNRRGMVTEAVESALAQRYPDLEVVVSDNASEDGTREAMQAYRADPRFHYFRNEANLGMVANWRKAVFEHARGDFFLILSDDDRLIDPDYISKAMDLAREHPDVVIVYAGGYILDESTGTRQELRLPFRSLERGTTVFASRDRVFPQDFTLCNVLFKRSLALELDAFDNPLNACCDSELFLKACLFGNVGVIHELVSQYRLHGANLILQRHEDLRVYTAMLDHYFKPRRMAIERGALTRQQLRAFDEVTRLALRRTVLLVEKLHPGRVGELIGQLWRTDRRLTFRALRNGRFAKLALRGLGPRLRAALHRRADRPRRVD